MDGWCRARTAFCACASAAPAARARCPPRRARSSAQPPPPPPPPRFARPLRRSAAALALACALTVSANVAPAHARDAVLSDSPPQQRQQQQQQQQQRTERELRDMSRRNTRVSGENSQLFAAARRAAAAADWDAALAMYDTLVRDAPSFAPAYSNRANILVARRNFADAERDYDRALTLAPLDSDAWLVFVNRGATRLAMGRNDDALADLNQAYRLRGDDFTVLSNRATVYEALGKWDNAIRDYQNALKSNDVQPFWIRYALVLFQRNKSFEAISILKRVAARFPDVNDVHAALALVYYDRGDLAAAETEWSAVDRPRLFENQSFLSQERKWPPRAIATLNNFRHLNPQ